MRPEPSYTLRRAGAADAAAVRDMFHKSFTATFGHLYPAQELAEFLAGCSEERFRHECTDADHAVMLGEDADGLLLGYCTLGPYDLETNSSRRWWVLRQLYLDEAAKGTGLAQTLMDWAIGEARAQGYEELSVGGRAVYVKGEPATLYRSVREAVGFKKRLDYLPFDC